MRLSLHVRHCILYEHELGHEPEDAVRRISEALGEGIVTLRTCKRWFERFNSGNKELDDRPRSGRPRTSNLDSLNRLVYENPHATTRILSRSLGIAQSTVCSRLEELGKVSKLGTWVPRILSIENKMQRTSICSSMLSRCSQPGFLDRIVTGDEKWVFYENPVRKREWCDKAQRPSPTAKRDLHSRKIMLSVWWDSKGILYFELLPQNTTVTAELYCQQLDRLQAAIQEKRNVPTHVLLLHDNARPHTARMTQEKIAELGWEILPHPPYSPDMAPSDYHLFLSLQNHLQGRNFEDRRAVETDISQFFESKPIEFYERGIKKLPTICEYILNHDGDYYIKE